LPFIIPEEVWAILKEHEDEIINGSPGARPGG